MAYYSALVRVIYHECLNCHVGDNIEPKNMVEGRPPIVKLRTGRTVRPRLCRVCERLRDEVDCTPGIP